MRTLKAQDLAGGVIMVRVTAIDKTDVPSPDPARAAEGVMCWRFTLACGHSPLLYASKIRPRLKHVSCAACTRDWIRGMTYKKYIYKTRTVITQTWIGSNPTEYSQSGVLVDTYEEYPSVIRDSVRELTGDDILKLTEPPGPKESS